MTATFLVGDVFDKLATIPDHSVDLVTTSPPFWRQRAYLPADHPDKAKEIGQEASPAEFIAVLLRLTAEFRRILSKYGSIAVELGDTMAGSGGGGGDLIPGSGSIVNPKKILLADQLSPKRQQLTDADPLPKSHCQIPELYRAALAYGDWPILSGTPHPAGRWIIRNRVVWCRPNPTPGDDGDKFRRATSDIVCATLNPKRWWDGDAVREEGSKPAVGIHQGGLYMDKAGPNLSRGDLGAGDFGSDGTRPLYDWWEIAPKGYEGAHYAVWTPEIARRLILTMCPAQVCRTCGEPRRRIVDSVALTGGRYIESTKGKGQRIPGFGDRGGSVFDSAKRQNLGWSDCGHDNYRPGLVLDPFAGSGTTLAVAVGNGRDAIGIDLDDRNADLARERCGMFLEVIDDTEPVDVTPHNPTINPKFRVGYQHGNPSNSGDRFDYGAPKPTL